MTKTRTIVRVALSTHHIAIIDEEGDLFPPLDRAEDMDAEDIEYALGRFEIVEIARDLTTPTVSERRRGGETYNVYRVKVKGLYEAAEVYNDTREWTPALYVPAATSMIGRVLSNSGFQAHYADKKVPEPSGPIAEGISDIMAEATEYLNEDEPRDRYVEA